MQINFFLEFPEAGLGQIKLITFPCIVYVAARTYNEFLRYKERLMEINPSVEAAYWPILKKSYWISPFSFPWELKKLRKELENRTPKELLRILLDLELPMLNKKLFLINFFHFWQNKRRIKKLFSDAKSLNLEIATAESDLSLWGETANKVLRFLGFSYAGGRKRIIMCYSSILPRWRREICKIGIKKYHDTNLEIGLGAIATGALGNEPEMSPEALGKDLLLLEGVGIDTAVIFQLTGLNPAYMEVINRHV